MHEAGKFELVNVAEVNDETYYTLHILATSHNYG
jgi:hypothetical protein